MIKRITCYGLLFFLTASICQAELTDFSGVLSVDNGGWVLNSSGTRFRIKPATVKATNNLTQLSPGDFISGVGEKISSDLVLIRSIDFIGLKKMLGAWRNNKTIFNFISFVNIRAVSETTPPFPWKASPLTTKTISDYTYSLSPGKANTFRMFLSVKSQVKIAELAVSGNRALIRIFDPITGNAVQSLNLEKIP